MHLHMHVHMGEYAFVMPLMEKKINLLFPLYLNGREEKWMKKKKRLGEGNVTSSAQFLRYLASQASTWSCQVRLLAGLVTQWFSSG